MIGPLDGCIDLQFMDKLSVHEFSGCCWVGAWSGSLRSKTGVWGKAEDITR